jgi:hypothetical protein
MEAISINKHSVTTIRSSSAPVGLWPLLIDRLYVDVEDGTVKEKCNHIVCLVRD